MGADEITNTHTYITCYIVTEVRQYRSVLPHSKFTFLFLHILCVAVILFILKAFNFFFEKKTLSFLLHPVQCPASVVKTVFPVRVLCIPG